ncbi:MAG: hypothetical protein ACRC62_23305, partial [Microcoleus sp.]
EDRSSLGGIEPQTNLPFIPHQIKDYGQGIPVEIDKNRKQALKELTDFLQEEGFYDPKNQDDLIAIRDADL